MIASRNSVGQSSSLAASRRQSAACVVGSPRTSQPASISVSTQRRQMRVARPSRSTSSVSAAPQTPVRRILALSTICFAMSRSAALVDVDVADAFEMREHRHARFGLHARRPGSLPPRGTIDVDGAVEARRA